MEPLDNAESLLASPSPLLQRIKTKHTLQPPTCHPPSSLDFEMDGKKMSICSEAYIAYTSVWMECVGGKKSIPEDEVVQVLSLSGLSLQTLAKVWDSTSNAFVNPDDEHGLKGLSGTSVRWEKFVVLLSVSHQSSGLDLESYLGKFIKPLPPPGNVSIPKSPNPSYNDIQAVVNQLGQSAIKDEKVQNPRTFGPPKRHRKQHSAPISTMIQAHLIQRLANIETVAESSLLKESGPAVDNSLKHNHPQRPAPVPQKPAKRAGAPPIPQKPARLATFPPVPPKPDVVAGYQPMNQLRAPTSDATDGFREYSETFVRPPPIPRSLRASTSDATDGFREYSETFVRPPPIPRSLRVGWNPQSHSFSSTGPNELPGSLETFSRVPNLPRSSSDDELYLGESRRPPSHNIVDISELSDFVPPLLSESFQSAVRGSTSDIAQPSMDPENAPIPLSTLQSPLSGNRHSKYWELAASTSPLSYDVPEIQQSNIGGESLPIITAETRQIARNRLIALKDQSQSAKGPINRRKSVLGFKKEVEAEFSLSFLASALERAVEEDDLPLVATFIEFGADPNYRQNVTKTKPERHSALQIAATEGYTHIIDYLIGKRADSIAINRALISATAACQLNLAMRLISVHGADVNTLAMLPAELPFGVSKHEIYINALGLAANIKEEQDRIPFVEFLIDRQCDVNGIIWSLYKTTNNQQFGFGYSNLAMFVPQCAATVDRLLQAGAHAHTIRQEATREAVHQFRQAGFHCQSMAIVQPISCLWRTDLNINSSRCLSILAQLVQHGSDPKHCEINGISELMEDQGCKKSPLARAIKSQDIDGVEKLLQLRVSPNSLIASRDFQPGKNSGYALARTALNYAAQYGTLTIIQSLLAHCAEVNRLSNIYPPLTCQSGESALAQAASSGYLEIVKALVLAGANVNDGSLHKAAQNAQVEVVQFLMNQGAKLDKIVDQIPWPTSEGLWEGNNPDVNRNRKPRGDVLCFAMFWPGSKRQTTEDEKVNYLALISILLNDYEAHRLPIDQIVLRAALDNNNLLGLEALFNFSFTSSFPVLNLGGYATIYYIVCSDSSTQKSIKSSLPLTPVQYALMMHCDESVVGFLVTKGANEGRVIYSQKSSDATAIKGTKLTWKKWS